MRVSYLSGSYIPGRGADSVHVMRMCDAMAGLGHEVTLHARVGPERAEDDFLFYGTKHRFKIVKHARPQVRVVGALAYGALVARHLSRHPRPDLLYAREVYGLRFALPLGIPHVFESHWNPKHFVQAHIEATFFKAGGFRRLVLISEALRGIYRHRFPWLAPDRLLVAHDAADVPPDRHPTRDASVGRPLQIGYVGGFLPGYGLDLIEALARSRPDLDFRVVGGTEPTVAARRARHDKPRNLTFHGFVAPARLSQVYADFDVVLAPFQSNTAHIDWISPMKLFEYMSFGKPIICSDFPVMREILTPRSDALLVPASDLRSWQAALDELADPHLRQRLGENARLKHQQQHTWSLRAERVLGDLKEPAEGQRARWG